MALHVDQLGLLGMSGVLLGSSILSLDTRNKEVFLARNLIQEKKDCTNLNGRNDIMR